MDVEEGVALINRTCERVVIQPRDPPPSIGVQAWAVFTLV
jgi:hypothetical protein